MVIVVVNVSKHLIYIGERANLRYNFWSRYPGLGDDDNSEVDGNNNYNSDNSVRPASPRQNDKQYSGGKSASGNGIANKGLPGEGHSTNGTMASIAEGDL